MFTYCLYHIVARFATAYIFSLKAALYYLYSMPPINEKGEKLRDFNIARNSVAPHNPTPHLTPAN